MPTQAIIEGFDNAKAAVKDDPDTLGVYLPLLSKLDLHLFEICKNAEELSASLVRTWLKNYLLKAEPDADARATEITNYLSSQKDRLSHGRPITVTVIKEELKIRAVFDLRGDQILRDLIGELWAEIEWFVENTPTAKFFENAYGVAFRRTFQAQQQVGILPFPFPFPQPAPQPVPQPPTTPQGLPAQPAPPHPNPSPGSA